MFCNLDKHRLEIQESDCELAVDDGKLPVDEAKSVNRREFIKGAAFGLIGTAVALNSFAAPMQLTRLADIKKKTSTEKAAKVALIKGDERYSNVYAALNMIKQDIKRGIGNKQVVIKPNFVVTNNQLSATHVDCTTAILDVLKQIYDKQIIIAESPADGPAARGFDNYGYQKLLKTYDVKFMELDDDEPSTLFILDKNLQPLPIQVSSMMMDADVYLISSAVMKTHDTVVTTLSLKNILMGAPLKINGKHYKRDVHQGIKQINYTFFQMTPLMKPDLAIIDGFQGMEGNGPVGGTAVDTKVAIASTDFLAADRTAVEVMGIDFSKIGYLNYCADANLGVADLSRVEVLGEKIANCKRKFKLHENIEQQYQWMDKI